MASEVKLTKAQRKLLEKAPQDWGLWPCRGFYRIPSCMFSPTPDSLRKKGLIEVDTIPLRWRITKAGRAALNKGNE